MLNTTGLRSFNPLPTVKPGDANFLMLNTTGLRSFNPLPTVKPGDASATNIMATYIISFNPLPTVKPGDACRAWLDFIAYSVSIRSRLLSREMRGAFDFRSRYEPVSIRSRLLSREMRSAVTPATPPVARFNPLPTVKPGDAPAFPWASPASACFNPLPTVKPGDALPGHGIKDLVRDVSIRSRLLSREMPLNTASSLSIRSRLLSREMQPSCKHIIT